MSQPVNNTSDDSSEVASTISFNRPGIWGVEDIAAGPALLLPAQFAGLILVGHVFVEFLYVGAGKNHVVFRVVLQTPITINDTVYYAVRIAMDLADEAFLVLDDSEVHFRWL